MGHDTPPSSDDRSSRGRKAVDGFGEHSTKSSRSGDTMEKSPSGLVTFWQELKRRKVTRVAITYAVVAWLIIQVADTTFEGFGIPLWAFRFVMLCVILGFPVAIILAWAFELTPDGIKVTKIEQKETEETEDSIAHAKKRNLFSLIFAAAVPTLIFGALAIFFYFRSEPSPPVTPDQLEGGISHLPSSGLVESDKSIAVLPLENQSPDPDNAFFADGVQGDVILNLGKIKDLLVIGRTSTQQYRDTVKTLRQIGEELRVRYLVEGSVRRAGNRVRIGVQLIDSQTGGNLWGETYDRSLDDIFAIQAEVAKEIGAQLHAVLLPEEIEEIEFRPTRNQEAYDYFLRARNLEQTQVREIVPLMEKAVELDPNLYQAWAVIAYRSIIRWNATRRLDSELYSKAQNALRELKRLAPGSPEVLTAQSYFSFSIEDNLELALQQSLEAHLTGAPVLDIGWRYFQLGQLDESQLFLEDMVRREPFFASAPLRLSQVYLLKNMWTESDALIDRNLNLYANHKFSDRLEWWQRRSSYAEFLRSGNLEDYLKVYKTQSTDSNSQAEPYHSLLLRDFSKSLAWFENYEGEGGINLAHGGRVGTTLGGINIWPVEVLKSLLYLELEENEKALTEAGKATEKLGEILSSGRNAKPNHLAALAISYAIQGETDKFEATLPKIRELTGNVNWRYRQQVECELKIAVACLVLGDRDKAIETLEAANKMDGPIFVNRELLLWFIFDQLKGDPKFDALLEE